MFIIRLLIDLNPFDLIEDESELVSGFNLEYYRRLFIYIFLSEYINLSFIRIILLIIFYGFNYWNILFNSFDNKLIFISNNSLLLSRNVTMKDE